MATTLAERINIRTQWRRSVDRRISPETAHLPTAQQVEQARKVQELDYYFDLPSARTADDEFDVWSNVTQESDPSVRLFDAKSGETRLEVYTGIWKMESVIVKDNVESRPGISRVHVSLRKPADWETY